MNQPSAKELLDRLLTEAEIISILKAVRHAREILAAITLSSASGHSLEMPSAFTTTPTSGSRRPPGQRVTRDRASPLAHGYLRARSRRTQLRLSALAP